MNNTKQSIMPKITEQLDRTKILDENVKRNLSIYLAAAVTETELGNEELIKIINFSYAKDLPGKEHIVNLAKRALIINKVKSLKVQVVSGRLQINDKSYLQLSAEEKIIFHEYLKDII